MPKICSHQGCKKHPVYGNKEERPTRCKLHAENGMENVVNKRCDHQGCMKFPSYGITGKRASRCKEHADNDMVNVVNKRCDHQGCNTRPVYGIPGGRPTRCATHADKNMEDIVSKRCNHNGCMIIPTYGISGCRPTRCVAHADENMVDVVSKRCDHPGCNTQPSYGIPGGRPTRCTAHADKNMKDILSKRCPGYGGVECPVITFLTYGKDYCLVCDPEEKRRAIKKRDEYAFFRFLKKHNIPVTTEQYHVHFTCAETSRKYAKVDGIIVTPAIVILLEVDEDGHRHYDKACDAARTQLVSEEIILAYPEHELAWVRVNPTSESKKIRSARFLETVLHIKDLLKSPRTTTMMIGFD